MEENLFINFTQPIQNLSPAFCTNTNDSNIIQLLYRGLYRAGEEKPLPDLVFQEEWVDLRTLRLQLIPWSWSNGEKVKAEDFVQTWKRSLIHKVPNSFMLFHLEGAEDLYQGRRKDFQGAQAEDETTLTLTFKHHTPYFRELACHSAFYPTYRTEDYSAYQRDEFESGTKLVTNGFYQLDTWTPECLKLAASHQEASFSSIRCTFSTNYDTILQRFREGKLDVHDGGPVGEGRATRELEQYLRYFPFLSTYFLFLNNKSPLLQDSRVRRSFFHSFERQEFIRGDDKLPMTELIPSVLKTWTIELRPEETLTPPSGMYRFICNDEYGYVELAQKLIRHWERHWNIHVNLEVYAWNQFFEKLEQGDYEIARGGWVADYSDPLAFLEIFASGSSANFSCWTHSAFDDGLQQALIAIDASQRATWFQQLEYLILENAPIIPIYSHQLRQMVGPRVKRYTVFRSGMMNLRGLLLHPADPS